MLTNAISTLQQDNPDAVDDIGAFALPAQNADDTNLTIWEPNGLYIPKTTTGDKLAAAKKFVAFANSSEGCKCRTTPAPPVAVRDLHLHPAELGAADAERPAEVHRRRQGHAGARVPLADQGPEPREDLRAGRLRISSAAVGAKQYDQDVVQQAQQLGLKGW